MKKFGFTLAEVLITLGIIGVVAALTIPNLITNKEKTETVTKLKKEYSAIAQAVKMSEVDNGTNDNWNLGTSGNAAAIRQGFDTYWAPYLKISKYCDTYSDCGYATGDIKNLIGNIYNGNANIVNNTWGITVLLADGTVFNAACNKWYWIDINGPKGPNVAGKDIFNFRMVYPKGFVATGYDHTDALINTWYCTAPPTGDTNSGADCAEKIIRSGWQIAADYPWQ